MKLPNYENAIVPRAKIVEYLLSPTHRDGRSKAAFFTRYGFSVDRWEEFAAALLRHAAGHAIAKIEDSPFGAWYIIEADSQHRTGEGLSSVRFGSSKQADVPPDW